MITVALPHHRIHSGSLVLVNRAHGFVDGGQAAPVPVRGPRSSIKLQRRAAASLSKLMADIGGWDRIVLVSGWRSLEEQQRIWDATLAESGLAFTQQYVAVPGHSEHQTGLAVDLGLKRESLDPVCPKFPYSGICQTFRQAAARYGFIERYPAGKEAITGIGHEPWHFRYVGAPHAAIMADNDLTLEEYIAFIRQCPYGRDACRIRSHGRAVRVSYLRAEQRGSTRLEIDGSAPYAISGNNTDGFVITEWGQSRARETAARGLASFA